MEILFLVPPAQGSQGVIPVDRVYGCNYGYDYKTPLHLLLLATIAKQAGHTVELLDCPAQGYNRKKFLRYLGEHPRLRMVVFFSVWLSRAQDLATAALIASVNRETAFVFCGSYPSWKPELFIPAQNYYVIRGEPEQSLIRLLSCGRFDAGSLQSVPGLSFVAGGVRYDNPSAELCDIQRLPIPDRSLVRGRYFFNRLVRYPATVMCVSRGCSYRCTYCAPHALDQAIQIEYGRTHAAKPPLRLRSVEATVEEFRQIAAAGYKSVEVCDNQFPWEAERTKQICQAIAPLGLQWICYARCDHLKDKGMVRMMKEAGCQMVYLGTESYSQAILDDIKKDARVEDHYAAVKVLKECAIEPEVSVLVGASERETPETVALSVREAIRQKTHFIHCAIAQPLPDTALFRQARERGWLKEDSFVPQDNTQNALLSLPSISARSLRRAVRLLYLRHYLSPRFILRQVWRMRSGRQWVNLLKAGSRFVRVFSNARMR